MRNYQNRVLLGLALLSSVAMAHAENWVGVGGGVYVDTDSIKRNGDISIFDISSDIGHAYSEESADCKQGWVLAGGGKVYNRGGKAYGVVQYSTADLIQNMYSLACKETWYKFWK